MAAVEEIRRVIAPRRILVLGCSGRKLADPGLLPAIARYDGPSFRVLRRYLRSCAGADRLDIFVVSAEYGLISGEAPVPLYDRRLTPGRANELRTLVVSQLPEHVGDEQAVNVLLCGSRAYLEVLDGITSRLPEGSTVRQAPLRPGERLACLHDWLHGDSPAPAHRQALPQSQPIPVTLRGTRETLTAEEVLARGRQALAQGGTLRVQPAAWAVDLYGVTVSPKWLIGTSLGLERSAFGTCDALRVLAALGIPVRRLAM